MVRDKTFFIIEISFKKDLIPNNGVLYKIVIKFISIKTCAGYTVPLPSRRHSGLCQTTHITYTVVQGAFITLIYRNFPASTF